MKKCLFFLCLCLVPFVVFSSTTFTSQNPIELPSDNSVPVLDTNGNPLDPGSSYRIESIYWGGLGGDVYLGPSPNSSASCDNGVFRYNSDLGPPGTPVEFINTVPLPILPPPVIGIFENEDLNIRFNIPVAPECVRYRIWKVGDYNVSLGAILLETGGTLLGKDSSWFRIVKEPRFGYKLFNCPGPFGCPSCHLPFLCPLPCPPCQEVSVVIQDGKRRLALVDDQSDAVTFPLAVKFAKV